MLIIPIDCGVLLKETSFYCRCWPTCSFNMFSGGNWLGKWETPIGNFLTLTTAAEDSVSVACWRKLLFWSLAIPVDCTKNQEDDKLHAIADVWNGYNYSYWHSTHTTGLIPIEKLYQLSMIISFNRSFINIMIYIKFYIFVIKNSIV